MLRRGRQDSRPLLGFCVLIRLTPVAEALRSRPDCERVILGEEERLLWMRGVTRKRRVEFLAGRVAGKLALAATSDIAGTPMGRLDQVQILPQPDGSPMAWDVDRRRSPVSISHSTDWAVALAPVTWRPVSIDVEDAGSRVRMGAGLFHAIEEAQLQTSEEARLRWTLKETWSKFTRQGIQGRMDETVVVSFAGRLWLAVTARGRIAPTTVAAGGTSLTMALAVEGSQS